MASKDDLDFSNRSMEEILEQLDTDSQYSSRSYQNVELPRDYVDPAYMPQRGNLYFPEQYPPEPRNTLPFMFNTREDVMPTMVGMGGGNFMVYGTPNVERNMNVPNNMHFANKTNGSLSGLNNYPVDYSADYNLFSGGINAVGASFASPSPEPAGSGTPHLIENLVGHWGSDQSGTYSPFGSCVRNVHGQNLGDIGNERTGRKTRMVAEVRPMRPSYSDVLAKSVSNQKPGKPADGKTKPPEVKNGKGAKSSVGRSLSGNTHFNNRQNLSGLDDLSCTGSNSSLKAAGVKKLMDVETDEPLPKKWVSLDDLTGGLSDNDFLNEAKVKKASPKLASAKKVKDGWETIQLNNGKPTGGKVGGTKKSSGGGAAPKIQPVTREKEPSADFKFEPTRNKAATEDRKGTSTSQAKPLDGGKSGRRNSRGVQADKAKKSGRRGRRGGGDGWPAQMAARLDLIAAVSLRATLAAAHWLVSLVLDVFALSTNLAFYMCTAFWCSSVSSMVEHYGRACDWLRELSIVKRICASRFWPFRRSERLPPPSDDDDDDSDSEDGDGKKKKRLPGGLKHNLPLPSTGEEAMKRLLACKGKDPYSILGVSQDCTDDDIKKYYKRQAFLVHPDKNNQPGAEEAFKILVHAFDIIGEPEHRKSYDRTVEKTAQAEQAWSELADLLAQLHKKMEYVANTLRCTNCGKRHKRSPVNRPIYAARMCAQCKIHHSVREGDIWAETSVFGLMWRYFACMDGVVYDISEWAACQGGNLKNLKANTHQVQYRIVQGKYAQKNRSQQPTSTGGEPDLEEFINNLYSKPESGAGGDGGGDIGGRNRKHKRKK